jgi:hypothetical protein
MPSLSWIWSKALQEVFQVSWFDASLWQGDAHAGLCAADFELA